MLSYVEKIELIDDADRYLSALVKDKVYHAFTINSDLEVVKCHGLIQDDLAYYPNNYQNELQNKPTLYIQRANGSVNLGWWTYSKTEAVLKQAKMLEEKMKALKLEINRLQGIKGLSIWDSEFLSEEDNEKFGGK